MKLRRFECNCGSVTVLKTIENFICKDCGMYHYLEWTDLYSVKLPDDFWVMPGEEWYEVRDIISEDDDEAEAVPNPYKYELSVRVFGGLSPLKSPGINLRVYRVTSKLPSKRQDILFRERLERWKSP